METIVIIPTYNERENIAPLVKEILSLEDETGIIIVDDNSPDGTGQIADELSALYYQVKVIHRPAKLGLGTAHLAGFKKALEIGAERVITMDADFSHHPRYIPQLLAASEKYHLVIGSRYVDGGGAWGCSFERKLLSRVANVFARIALGLKARDCTAGFRCYRREVLEAIPLDEIFSEGYSFLIELLYICQRLGFLVGEVPILFENRQRGASKISKGEIIKALYTVLRLSFCSKPSGGQDKRF